MSIAKLLRTLFTLAILLISSHAHALHQDLEHGEYTRPALIGLGATAGIFITSEMHEGPTVFAGLYSMAALYLMNEYYSADSSNQSNQFFEDEIIVPLALVSMAVVNLGLLHDKERYSQHDVFIYNLAGTGLITAYAIWEHAHESRTLRRQHQSEDEDSRYSPRREQYWLPLLAKSSDPMDKSEYSGLAWITYF